MFFFFKQKTAYEIMPSLVGSEMCIRDSKYIQKLVQLFSQFLLEQTDFSKISNSTYSMEYEKQFNNQGQILIVVMNQEMQNLRNTNQNLTLANNNLKQQLVNVYQDVSFQLTKYDSIIATLLQYIEGMCEYVNVQQVDYQNLRSKLKEITEKDSNVQRFFNHQMMINNKVEQLYLKLQSRFDNINTASSVNSEFNKNLNEEQSKISQLLSENTKLSLSLIHI
eukprot:TRINITY_DN36898_c0_g1_i1.p1 TRINITY_DN36898_c0_g1~~TRINITY_DN36898_c0_g1_i1.p1  ORF type:complete len:222 (-),score=45.05 TRINITY_DN36898_c0_g1_i1:103-768(-)